MEERGQLSDTTLPFPCYSCGSILGGLVAVCSDNRYREIDTADTAEFSLDLSTAIPNAEIITPTFKGMCFVCASALLVAKKRTKYPTPLPLALHIPDIIE